MLEYDTGNKLSKYMDLIYTKEDVLSDKNEYFYHWKPILQASMAY